MLASESDDPARVTDGTVPVIERPALLEHVHLHLAELLLALLDGEEIADIARSRLADRDHLETVRSSAHHLGRLVSE